MNCLGIQYCSHNEKLTSSYFDGKQKVIKHYEAYSILIGLPVNKTHLKKHHQILQNTTRQS